MILQTKRLLLKNDYISTYFKNYEIVCLVHPDNIPSKKLLEKLHFKNEGYVEKINSIIFSMQLC